MRVLRDVNLHVVACFGAVPTTHREFMSSGWGVDDRPTAGKVPAAGHLAVLIAKTRVLLLRACAVAVGERDWRLEAP